MDYRKILKVYLLVAVPITVLTIIGSQVGLVENLVYQKSGARTRISFGFIYPTDFAAHIFYLSIAWLILRLERITYFEIISFFVLSGCLYLFCDALCGALCELLLAVAVLFVKLYIKLRVPIKPDKFVHMIFFIGCMILPILLAIVIILLSYYFTWSSDFLKKANFFLSGRPRMGNLAFSNYDITMFGDVINMNGYGGTTTHTFTRKDYFFLDSSYMWMLFRYGICGLLCSVGMTEAIMIKCRKNLFIIVSIALICVHSFIEHHFSGYEYNVLFLMAFASFESIAGYGKEKNRIENDLF
ncbi:MAG: hypothetical protein Q4C42_03480 [Clostridia bacterium]|nr:hypothetical protein [Clostridia bacterium]